MSAIVEKPKQAWVTTRDFVRETVAEMKKVTWPTRNEVVGTTVVVIITTFVFAVYLWVCDVLFYRAIDYLFARFGTST